MRKILFRGKRTDNGEWVQSGNVLTFNDEGEGKLNFIPKKDTRCVCVHDDDDNVISFKEGMFYKVIPETVGQYTGLTDKNGKKIFEGDILKGSWETILTIFFDEISSSYRVKTSTGHEREPSYYGVDKWEVVGNVYDTPELLKGEGR